MVAFRVVPVVDVKRGLAVHAVKGQRDAYTPVNCGWCKDGDIVSLVNGYEEIFGLHDLYVADLDAITDGKPNKAAYNEILAHVKGAVMIDAGITSITDFRNVAAAGFESVILGTESIPSLTLLARIIKENEHATIVSLDIKDGVVLSPTKQLAGINIQDAFRTIEGLGPAAVIFLDMSGVGARTGINAVARELVRDANTPLYLGGGVGSASDILNAREAGFAGVLVATALQASLISPEEVVRLTA